MWYEEPEKRPPFLDIVKSLSNMLQLEETQTNEEETSIISSNDEPSPYISVTA